MHGSMGPATTRRMTGYARWWGVRSMQDEVRAQGNDHTFILQTVSARSKAGVQRAGVVVFWGLAAVAHVP